MKKLIRHENIEGMARIGIIDDVYDIYVNTDDPGKIPHFHFRNKNDWDEFHTCIRIDKPEYFHHKGKEDILNSKMKKELQNFMIDAPSIKRYSSRFDNNWDLICFMWDINNSDVMIDDDVVQPDYTELR